MYIYQYTATMFKTWKSLLKNIFASVIFTMRNEPCLKIRSRK